MAYEIEDYAVLTEILFGGYTLRGAGVRQCSKKIQSLFFGNDYGKLIERRNFFRNQHLFEPQLMKAIEKSAALRYFTLCSLHDAEITAIAYNEHSKRFEMEMSLLNCCHGLALCEQDDEKQKIALFFAGAENCESILKKLVFDNDSSYYFIQQRLTVNDKTNFKFQIRKCGVLNCSEFWIEVQCNEVYIIEKH